MKEFLKRVLYGKFLVGITLPSRVCVQLALPIDQLDFEHPEQASEIFELLPQMHEIAGQNDVSYRAIHNLSWLCDLASARMQQQNLYSLHYFLKDFLLDYQYYDNKLWEISLLSQRLLYSLHAFERLFREYQELSLQENYMRMVVRHAAYLRKNLKRHKSHNEYGLFLTRSAIACLLIREERPFLQPSLVNIYAYLDTYFNADGGHKSRNSSLHLKLLSELIILRDLLVKAGINISHKLQTVIVKSCDYLEFMRHPDGGFAVFNGSSEASKYQIDSVFSKSPVNITPPQSCVRDNHYYRMQAENIFIIADFYLSDSNDIINRSYQGALSFEMSIGTKRVFVNCGSGDELGDGWKNALSSSDAHNTISIKNYNLTANSKKPEIPNKKHTKIISAVTTQGIVLEGTHGFDAIDTQKQSFNLSHYRKILLHKNGHVLQGEDWICVPKANFKKLHSEQALEYYVRFHLSPDVRAEISKTGSVILHIPEFGHYIFNAGSGKVMIEESVYTGRGMPKAISQIVIKVNATNEITKIRWTMQIVQKKREQSAKQDADMQKEEA